MKRMLIFLLALTLILSLSACGEQVAASLSDFIEPIDESEDVEEIIPEEPILEEWGVVERDSAENAQGDRVTIYINFPSLGGIRKGTGQAAYQMDETLVILDTQQGTYSPNAESVDDVFGVYQEQANNIMEDYRSDWDYADFQFEISEQEHVEINGFSMCRYEGIHSYTIKGEPQQQQYVAYAAQLNSNGAYVYWIVLDESEDQSLGDTISEYAEKMAWSLEEHP